MLDALLKAKWNGMKTALSEGDVEDSLAFIAKHKKELYEYNLQLMSSQMSEISATMTYINLIQVTDGVVEYGMWTEYEGQTCNFLVRFIRDKDGIWRIEFF